jgi:hypothetical protein
MGMTSMIDLLNESMFVRALLRGFRLPSLELRNRSIHGRNHPCHHLVLAFLTNPRLCTTPSLWCYPYIIAKQDACDRDINLHLRESPTDT